MLLQRFLCASIRSVFVETAVWPLVSGEMKNFNETIWMILSSGRRYEANLAENLISRVSIAKISCLSVI